MAINDNATLVVGSGNYLTAPVGTAMPADLTAPGVAWDIIGHTSLDSILGISSDGGDSTVLGTLQNKSLRTIYSARTDTFAITVQQFDEATLKLYYGSNSEDLSDGSIGVVENPQVTDAAFLAVFLDGENVFAYYAPKSEIFRGDDVDISDTESLAGLPLAIKPVKYNANKWTYAVTPLGSTG